MADIEDLRKEAIRISKVSNPNHKLQNEWFGNLLLDLLNSPDIFERANEVYQFPSNIIYNDSGSTVSGTLQDVYTPNDNALDTDSGDFDIVFTDVTEFDYLELIYSSPNLGEAFAISVEDVQASTFSNQLFAVGATNGEYGRIKIPYAVFENDFNIGNDIHLEINGTLNDVKSFQFITFVTHTN